MSFIFRLMIVSALMSALLTPASAQFGGRGRGTMNGIALLNRAEVQKELNLTEDQKTQIQDLNSSLPADMRSRLQNLRNLDQAQRQKVMNEMRAEVDKKIAGVLKPDQYTRYRQIVLQQDGLTALTRADVQNDLKFTDEQKAKVTEIINKSQEEQNSLRADMPDATDKGKQMITDRIQKLGKEMNDKLLALMTEDQQKQWKAMLGKPFELAANPDRRPNL